MSRYPTRGAAGGASRPRGARGCLERNSHVDPRSGGCSWEGADFTGARAVLNTVLGANAGCRCAMQERGAHNTRRRYSLLKRPEQPSPLYLTRSSGVGNRMPVQAMGRAKKSRRPLAQPPSTEPRCQPCRRRPSRGRASPPPPAPAPLRRIQSPRCPRAAR